MRGRPLYWIAACALLLIAAPALAQLGFVPGVSADTSARAFRTTFAIPEAPALTLLHDEGSLLVRPVDGRALMIAVSSFSTQEGRFAIPREFSMEVRPFMLAGGSHLSLAQYQAHAWLYRLRVSAATRRRGDAGPSQIGLGLRASPIDDGDARTNAALIAQIESMTDRIEAVRGRAIERDPMGPLVLTPDDRAQIDEIATELDAQVKAFSESHWNARALDVALGARLSSPDSTGRELRSDAWAAWLTYAAPVADWGQLLLGGNAGSERDAQGSMHGSGALNARLIFGVNTVQGFAEFQARVGEGPPRWFLNSGGEAGLGADTWIAYSAGLESLGGARPGLVSRLRFTLGLPGL